MKRAHFHQLLTSLPLLDEDSPSSSVLLENNTHEFCKSNNTLLTFNWLWLLHNLIHKLVRFLISDTNVLLT